MYLLSVHIKKRLKNFLQHRVRIIPESRKGLFRSTLKSFPVKGNIILDLEMSCPEPIMVCTQRGRMKMMNILQMIICLIS